MGGVLCFSLFLVFGEFLDGLDDFFDALGVVEVDEFGVFDAAECDLVFVFGFEDEDAGGVSDESDEDFGVGGCDGVVGVVSDVFLWG